MQPTTQAYKDALATNHTPAAQVTVDWRRDGNPTEVELAGVQIRRTITSDLDPAVSLITGHSAAEATIDLSGDPGDNTRHAVALYSPYRTDSDLYGVDVEGAPVQVSLGIAGHPLLPQFTGRLRDIPVTAADRAASLSALDGTSERLGVPASLPVVVGIDLNVIDTRGGLNSQWIVDHLARQGGYFSSPPPRPGCLVSATLHGSFGAEVGRAVDASHVERDPTGTFDVFLADPIPYAPGRFALAPTPEPGRAYAGQIDLAAQVTPSQGVSLTFSGWVFFGADAYTDSNPLGVPVDVLWQLTSDDATQMVWVQVAATGPGVSNVAIHVQRGQFDPGVTFVGVDVTATGWHYLGVNVAFGSESAEMTVRLDGTDAGTDTETIAVMPAEPSPLTAFGPSGVRPCEAVQVTTESVDDPGFTWDDAFTPTSFLEPGLNELTATPPIPSDATCGQIIQAVAAAEAAVAIVDETGVFRFWNRQHWWAAGTAAATVQRIIDATTALKDTQISRGIDRVRNVIGVTVTPVTILDHDVVWGTSEAVEVPALGQVTLLADLRGAQAYDVDTTGWVIPAGGAASAAGQFKSGYRACTARDGNGDQVTNLVMVVDTSSTPITVTITNPNTFSVWLVTPAGASSPNGGGVYPSTSTGQPAVELVGRLITTQRDTGIDGAPTPGASSGVVVKRRWQPSVDVFGAQPLTLQATPWMQRVDQGAALAGDVLTETAWPRPQLSGVEVIADASIQLGDRVQLHDTSGATGVDDPFWVVGVTTAYRGGRRVSAVQTLALRAVAGPGQWILGVPGRSELGVTTVL